MSSDVRGVASREGRGFDLARPAFVGRWGASMSDRALCVRCVREGGGGQECGSDSYVLVLRIYKNAHVRFEG